MNTQTNENNDVQPEVKDELTILRELVSKRLTATLETGNFAVTVGGSIKLEKLIEYLTLGIVYDLQRKPATKAYLAVAGVPGKKAGSTVFPPKFDRDSVPFTDRNAMVMKDEVLKHFATIMESPTVLVSKHEKGESSDGRNRARGVLAQWKEAGKVEVKVKAWSAASDIPVPSDLSNDELVVEFIHQCTIKP